MSGGEQKYMNLSTDQMQLTELPTLYLMVFAFLTWIRQPVIKPTLTSSAL